MFHQSDRKRTVLISMTMLLAFTLALVGCDRIGGSYDGNDPADGSAAIDLTTGALSGLVWSESLGWVKLAGTAGSGAAYGVRLNMPN